MMRQLKVCTKHFCCITYFQSSLGRNSVCALKLQFLNLPPLILLNYRKSWERSGFRNIDPYLFRVINNSLNGFWVISLYLSSTHININSKLTLSALMNGNGVFYKPSFNCCNWEWNVLFIIIRLEQQEISLSTYVIFSNVLMKPYSSVLTVR